MPTPSEQIASPEYRNLTFGQAVQVGTPANDQTGYISTQDRGLHSDNNPYPTNPIGGTIELARQAVRQTTQTFGATVLFVAEQAGLHVLNPIGANIVNPLVITNALPAEGLLGTAFDGQSPTVALGSPPGGEQTDRTQSAAAGGTLGQEEGAAFFGLSKIRTVSDIVDVGVNALAGALGLKDDPRSAGLSPKGASFEKRLAINTLTPDTSSNIFDAYNTTYGQTVISGVKTADLAVGFAPIDSGANTTDSPLTDDSMLRDNLERAFESNAPLDARSRYFTNSDGLTITQDRRLQASPVDQPDVAPTVQGSGMVFPFYFESLNFFRQHPDKFITFQATFNGLSESYTPNWQTKTYFGRPTSVYTYEYTTRAVSFDFIIWAPNRIALSLVKDRVNWLAKHTYPSYERFGNTSIVKEAPVIRFTIGDIFKNTPAVINSLRYDWLDRWELTKDLIMPQAVKVSIQLTILHDRFMQNTGFTGISTDNLVSSDFYEFIKPPARSIGDPTNVSDIISQNVGEPYVGLTEDELGGVLSDVGNFNKSSASYVNTPLNSQSSQGGSNSPGGG